VVVGRIAVKVVRFCIFGVVCGGVCLLDYLCFRRQLWCVVDSLCLWFLHLLCLMATTLLLALQHQLQVLPTLFHVHAAPSVSHVYGV